MKRRILLPTILSIGLAVLLQTDTARAAWKPVRPAGKPRRVRLIAETGAASGEVLPGIWTVLAPGDSFMVDLSGAGRIRVRSRPVRNSAADTDVFRFAVDLGDTIRRFARRSVWEGTYRLRDATEGASSVRPISVGLGDEDQVELDWQAGSAVVRLTNREKERVLLVRLLVGDGVSPRRSSVAVGAKQDRRFGLDIALPQLGWDSNAYLTAKADSGRDGKWFLPVELGAAWFSKAGSRTDLEASYAFKGAFYDEPILDERRHRVRLAGKVRMGSQRPRKGTDLLLAYRFTNKNDTYYGRGDREEFETIDPGTGQPVPLGNRFDYNEHRGTVALVRNLGRPLRIWAGLRAARRDYLQDYSSYPDIYALDQDRLAAMLVADWRVAGAWVVSGEVFYETRDYDQKFSRDADGNQVPDAPTFLRDLDLIAKASYGRGPGLRLDGEFKYFRSSDQYAGYWDYAGAAFEIGIGWRWPRGHRVTGSLRHSNKDYANARVGYDPAGPLRVKSALNLRIKADYVLGPAWEVNFNVHYKDSDNNTVAFAYERLLIRAGLSFQR